MNELFNKIKSKKKSEFLKNMSWLFLLDFSNKLIPFFTFPYITRIFLPEGFGIITFCLAFIAYFQTFIDYGFNLTGARKIAIVEKNKKELSRIYTAILATKLLFFFVSFPIIILLTFLNAKLFEYHEVIFIFLLMVLSNVLMPTWLFQGLQKVKYMTIISFSVRIVFLICVFTLIKSPDDIQLYALIYSASFFLIAVISLIIINVVIKVKMCKIYFVDILEMIKDGFHVFTSSAVISLMSSTGVIVLGVFYVVEYSGYYSGISKINQIIIMLFYPIGQALFPYHSKKFVISFMQGYYSVIRIAKIVIPIFVFISVCVVLCREQLVWLILGQSFVEKANLLVLLGFLPTLSIISNFMGTQILVASGYTKAYSRAFLKGAIISISLYFILGYNFAIWGVTIAAIVGQIVSLVFLFVEVRKILKTEKEGGLL
ncbi:oligosaccharide flippase family protein [Filibacter tadaridae]|uniref:O-antigen transporter n=1 Tax=Filibacter tadaridae TaxID=2483811 RepID=A0A3P5XG18_9BACL|nr:oligosaccharide flippase family protein [Filibacter tadaridae]VDC33702.1 Putative O-antigen transporter [Filibacter tadaridae]